MRGQNPEDDVKSHLAFVAELWVESQNQSIIFSWMRNITYKYTDIHRYILNQFLLTHFQIFILLLSLCSWIIPVMLFHIFSISFNNIIFAWTLCTWVEKYHVFYRVKLFFIFSKTKNSGFVIFCFFLRFMKGCMHPFLTTSWLRG